VTTSYMVQGIDRANSARHRLGLGWEPVGDLLKLVREDGLVVFAQPAGQDAPEGMFAEYEGRAFAWVNSSKPPQRVRFTIAHEYGHYVFHDPGLTVDKDVLRGDSTAEKRARVFAAEFLVPQAGVVSWLSRHQIDPQSLSLADVVRLGAYFGVSAETALYRLKNTSGVTQKAFDSLKAGIDSGDHRKLSAYLAYREWDDTVSHINKNEVLMPPEMQEASWRLFQNGLLSVERLAHLLRRDVDSVQADIQGQGIIPHVSEESDEDFFTLP
jgi:Zn-dependent peptidase ImmA (M78 family)